MNKLVVVAKNSETYFIKRLMAEVGNAISLFNPWADLILPESQKYLVRTTGVYGSDLDLLILKSLAPDKIVNPFSSLQLFRSKLTQYHWFEDHQFPVPAWISLKGADLLTIEKFFRLYPYAVVKPSIGQGGWGVEGLNWERFKSWWKKKQGRDEDYILQNFIPSATELRYFFIQGEAPIVLERKSKSAIAANFQKQGQAVLSKMPDEWQPLIDRLVTESGLNYGAIDLLLDHGTLQILEVNAVPGIEQLESVSGQNVMSRLISAKFFCQIL